MRQGDGSGDGTFSLEFEGRVASVPFSAGPTVVLAAIKANLTDPTGSPQSPLVSLEEASSTRRSYMVTFPQDLGDVATLVGYGDGGVLSVAVAEETRGSVQVCTSLASIVSLYHALNWDAAVHPCIVNDGNTSAFVRSAVTQQAVSASVRLG